VQPGEVVKDRFEVETVAGFGGMGTVYRAHDRATGDTVALKVLRGASESRQAVAEASERFAREIRVLAAVRHPGIVRYVADGHTHDGEQWLAMEWLEGESLSQRLGRTGLTATESIELARRVAEAIGAAHERGIVHRDIKPSNLFLLGGDLERVKVLDFGVARIVDATRAGATRTGVMIGTPGYMSPEQVKTEREITARADVFAVGCVLFECLTGRAAFVGEHMLAVLAKILLEDTPHITDLRPELPEVLDALVYRAMAKQPEQRPRDCVQLAAELTALGRVDTPERPPTSVPAQALTATERRLLCVVLIGESVPGDRTLVETPGIRETLDTASGELPVAALGELADLAQAHGAHLDRLADGAYVVTLVGSGGASDQVMQAARCALAMKAVVPDSPIALATGRGVMAGRWPVGEAIDRAACMLAHGPQRVRLDDVTAGLLDTRFEVGGDEAGLYLERERDIVEVTRTLLGKQTPCVGRDRELATLFATFEESIAEPVARAVLVTGALGIGKSRVRFELMRRIAERPGERVEIWIGRGDPLRAGSPFGMIAPALRRAAGIHDSEPVEVRRHKLRARVQRNASLDLRTTTLFLGELIGTPFPDEDSHELRAARQDPLLMVDQVRRAFEHFLAVETSAQPVVIVLEDLHWGDLPTVKLVDSALRALPDRPWMVVALARPEVHEMFPRLWSERDTQELVLRELTSKSSEKLVRGVLGDAASTTLVARLVEQAGGNAFYLEELIRAVADGKQQLPETVLALVQSRLERLESDARRVLRAASVYGHRFWRGGVTALVGTTRETGTRVWLDELVERELIARSPASRFPSEHEYQFRHALVREAAYAMLTDDDRRLGHRLAGDWLELAGENDPMALAEHFERGGDAARAAEPYFHAAEQALAACDFAGVATRAERGVACGAKGELLGALRLVQAEAHKWTGDFAAAALASTEALGLLPYGSARWCAAAGEAAEATGKLDDVAKLAAIGDQLRVVPAHAGSLSARITATAHAAFQLFSHGHYDLAQILLDRIELAASDLVDPGVLARVYQARSSRAMVAGDAGAYLESEQAAAAAFERAGDLRYACMQRGHVGYACLEIGAYADAERWLRETLEAGTRLGLSNVVATAKHNLGRALQYRGALDEALAIETEAFETFRAQNDRRLEGAARVYLSYILLDRGELERARHELELALATAHPPMRPQILASLARVWLAGGRTDQALAAAREASAMFERLGGGVEEGESLIRLMVIETLAASGQLAEARTAARSAYIRLVERADRISDPLWRTCFVERVPENARTRQLAIELAVAE
jgi:tetratricopeptide (TPR) repeat protein